MENYQISFEKAKKMSIYHFNFDEKNIKMIQEGGVKEYDDRYTAVLEFGNIDIEMNYFPPDKIIGTDKKKGNK